MMDLHVYLHSDADDDIRTRLDAILELIKETAMSTQDELNSLRDKVTANTTATQSVVTLVQGLAQQIRDAADDPAEIRAIADSLDANTAALSKAVTDNTPTPPTP